MGDLQHGILYHKEHINSKRPHFSRYCDAEGATFKVKMLICGKDTGVFKSVRAKFLLNVRLHTTQRGARRSGIEMNS